MGSSNRKSMSFSSIISDFVHFHCQWHAEGRSHDADHRRQSASSISQRATPTLASSSAAWSWRSSSRFSTSSASWVRRSELPQSRENQAKRAQDFVCEAPNIGEQGTLAGAAREASSQRHEETQRIQQARRSISNQEHESQGREAPRQAGDLSRTKRREALKNSTGEGTPYQYERKN